MHHLLLNIPDLLLPLWRGTIECEKGDNKNTWDFAVFRNLQLWREHGAAVAEATPYLPGSFDRPPRNPAEKISSGYRAVEYGNYLYGLGPAYFYPLFPHKYWVHFCKLVRGVRLLSQRTITSAEVVEANRLLFEFQKEFEELYYRRMTSRLHYIRQSIHRLIHLGPETLRVGPNAIVNQSVMERTIGNLGEEIRQPSQAFANLQQRAIRRCQINALKAMVPRLNPATSLPRGAYDLGEGFVLLRAAEETSHKLPEIEATVLVDFMQERNADITANWLQQPKLAKWARLQLPNGQIARSLWKEQTKTLEQLRTSRNVKVRNLTLSK